MATTHRHHPWMAWLLGSGAEENETEVLMDIYTYKNWDDYNQALHPAREEELKIWLDHCEKRGFLQSFRDDRKIDKPSNSLQLLYYCPIRNYGCSMILDAFQYHRFLAKSLKEPAGDWCAICGPSADAQFFKRFLPSQEYIEKYGAKDLKVDRKDK